MKRKKLYVLLSAVFWGLFFSATASAVPTVHLDLLDTSISVGDTFQVEVWADGDGFGLDLLSFSFDVETTSTGIIGYAGYTLESSFDDDTLFTGSDVAGSIFQGIPDNDVLLATLSFTALSAGSDTLSTVGLYDGFFSGLYYEPPVWDTMGYDIDASLAVTISPAPIPEPPTVILCGIGFLGLIGCRLINKKRIKNG